MIYFHLATILLIQLFEYGIFYNLEYTAVLKKVALQKRVRVRDNVERHYGYDGLRLLD